MSTCARNIRGFVRVRTGNEGKRGSMTASSLRACGSKNSLNLTNKGSVVHISLSPQNKTREKGSDSPFTLNSTPHRRRVLRLNAPRYNLAILVVEHARGDFAERLEGAGPVEDLLDFAGCDARGSVCLSSRKRKGKCQRFVGLFESGRIVRRRQASTKMVGEADKEGKSRQLR